MVRTLTTVCMAVAVLLTVAWPVRLMNRPTLQDPRPVRQAYARSLLIHTGAIVGLLVASGVGATLVSRQAKREYREAARRNMRELVEGRDEGGG